MNRTLTGTPSGTDGGGASNEPEWPVVPSDQIPVGTLEVLPLGPDLEPLPTTDVIVHLERLGAAFWSPPLGVPDPDTGVWTFQRVPYGKVQVHAWGDHVADGAKGADVKADRTERVEIVLDRAGAVAFRATLPGDEAPETVRVRLLSARTNAPVAVHFQTRRPDLLTVDVKATEATLGSEGLLFAVPPGRYVLEGVSPGGDEARTDVDVTLGKTTETILRFDG